MTEKILAANLERGKKWKTERAKAEFEQRSKDVEWMDSQDSIVKDIKAYEDSINKEPEKPVEEGDSKPKAKAKKAPRGA